MGLGKSLKKLGKKLKKILPAVVGLVATGGLGGSVLPKIFGKAGALASSGGALGGAVRVLQGIGGALFGKGAATGGATSALSKLGGVASLMQGSQPGGQDPFQQALPQTGLQMPDTTPSMRKWRGGA